MENILSKAIMFAAGALFGAGATWLVLKPYYQKTSEEEIKAIRDFYNEKRESEAEEKEAAEKAEIEAERKEYDSLVSKEGYTEVACHPYVIAPDEFEGLDGYQSISLTYYADGILTDDVDNIISDAEMEDMVGRDAIARFGEYDDAAVFVRNEGLKIDYEIIRDSRTFADVCEEYGLHQTEG